MNEFKYIYTVRDDYYYFPDVYHEETAPCCIRFYGNMTVVCLETLASIPVIDYVADKTRLYKVKEIK